MSNFKIRLFLFLGSMACVLLCTSVAEGQTYALFPEGNISSPEGNISFSEGNVSFSEGNVSEWPAEKGAIEKGAAEKGAAEKGVTEKGAIEKRAIEKRAIEKGAIEKSADMSEKRPADMSEKRPADRPTETLKPRVSTTVHTDTLKIHFKINEYVLLPGLGDNRRVLEQLRTYAPKSFSDNRFHYTFNSIEIAGGASPEGPYRWNQTLSKRRTDAIYNYIVRNNRNIDPKFLSTRVIGVDWDKLYDQVLVDTVLANKREVLKIIERVDFRALRRLDGGRTYRYLFNNKFPPLRSTWAVVKYDLSPIISKLAEVDGYKPQPPLETGIVYQSFSPQPRVEEPTDMVFEKKRWQVAVKTNALYDLLITPNIGVEVYLGKDWSLSGNWMYAWWKEDPDAWYHRIYGGDIELRRWFGYRNPNNPLTGWHLGGYAQIVTYDFEWGGRGSLGDKWSWGFGANAGYSKNIGRRLNLDFTLSAGYLRGEYKEYIPIDNCYVWQVTKMRNWIGPTKAEVSLVWLLGRW